MMTREDERKLVKKIMDRDEKALFSFIREHERGVYLFVQKKINDREKAEEITQDVFVDFLEALRDFQFQSSLKTFLYSIAKYKSIDVMRKKKVKKVLFSGLPDFVVERLGSVVIDDELEKKELIRELNTAFDSLPHKYALILRLKYIEGKRVKAIAESLSLNFKSTESLLFRARKAFIAVFNEKGS